MISEVLILPTGSCEYHGEFLPLDTDTIIAKQLADSIKNKLKIKTVILPEIKIGVSTEHLNQPGTVSDPLLGYATKILKMLEKKSRKNTLIVIINGHNGNTKILQAVISDFNYLHGPKVISPPLSGKKTIALSKKLLGEHDAHAGSFESSLLAFYEKIPEFIDKNRKYKRRVPGSMSMFSSEIINPLGIIKDTTKLIANKEVGRKLHEQMTEEMIEYILNQKNIIEVTKNAKS